MSVWEERHTGSPEKGLLLPAISSAAIKALHSIPQLGVSGLHLDLHLAVLTGFTAVITSHPSLATRLTACAVMAHTCYIGMVFARDYAQRGLLQEAPLCFTLVHKKDLVSSMYRIMQEALQVCLFHAKFLDPFNVLCPLRAAVHLMHCLICKIATAALLLLQGCCLSAPSAFPSYNAMLVLPVGATTVVSGPL